MVGEMTEGVRGVTQGVVPDGLAAAALSPAVDSVSGGSL
ncbi:hypothetical protein HX92_2387 [Mycobacterium tuberculosis]|uniref:Uncharacterized protein n=1 Tax=Mycobacterium tuberculosis (strain CDC 1551 / Oshkosh) TaxID=83331 RepID=Q8VIU8_MYCTO|nr:hypothetical protein MT3846 [Mycobacterium tuberculosis CDC1551]AGM02396.1 hypothetical protein CFBS_3964 [Mycobacterium tuberculosis CCDC5079]AHJ44606.1 hypothetical protein HKBS1_3961 [Mycobacterium tuberculosis HKBS1]AHJ48754.1 hypothetical protein HKBT2_3958 [Mycobacterium tuberculosis BT2]AHJ52894.1 hypothetical protein HKBT1_3948 [Mycobacterium tuberculosis BT1]AHJ57053.1 hypothetical protein CFBR_3969 [Mycobacterium tuberculosis CCDC5180]ALB20991.1 Hypothetical protein AFL40_3891 [M